MRLLPLHLQPLPSNTGPRCAREWLPGSSKPAHSPNKIPIVGHLGSSGFTSWLFHKHRVPRCMVQQVMTLSLTIILQCRVLLQPDPCLLPAAQENHHHHLITASMADTRRARRSITLPRVSRPIYPPKGSPCGVMSICKAYIQETLRLASPAALTRGAKAL